MLKCLGFFYFVVEINNKFSTNFGKDDSIMKFIDLKKKTRAPMRQIT